MIVAVCYKIIHHEQNYCFEMRYSATRFDPWVVIFMPLNHIKLKLQLQTEIPGYTLPVRRSALFCEFRQPVMAIRGPDSSVGVVIGCGLDGPGIESRWGEIFRTCPDRPWDPPSLLYNGYRVFPGGKEWPGCEADPSPPSSSVVKKE